MVLVIDVGNTNITLGLYKKEGLYLKKSWRIATDRQKTSDEFGILITQLFQHDGFDPESVGAVIISSVVPPIMYSLEAMTIKYFEMRPLIVGPGIKTGMLIHYDNPKQVGADRIVNAVAAFQKYGGPLVIVDFGTATTFCAVNEKGDYLGGTIAPGIKIASDALIEGTAKLPKVEIRMPDRVICRNTTESIQSGISIGQVGLVDYIVRRMIEELGGSVAKVVATGGLASMIATASETIEVIDKRLTLDGLKIIYDRNRA